MSLYANASFRGNRHHSIYAPPNRNAGSNVTQYVTPTTHSAPNLIQCGFFYLVLLKDYTEEYDQNNSLLLPRRKACATRLQLPNLPPLLIPGIKSEFLLVRVAHMITDCSLLIFVQLENKAEVIMDISRRIRALVQKRLNPVVNPAAGDIVVAKFYGDNCYYRGCVVAKDGMDDLQIFFVDYGNLARVSASDIFPPDEFLRSIPPQAISVVIDGIKSSSISESQLYHFLQDRLVYIQLLSTEPEREAFVVNMFVPKNKEKIDVAEVLSKQIPVPVLPTPEPYTAAAGKHLSIEQYYQDSDRAGKSSGLFAYGDRGDIEMRPIRYACSTIRTQEQLDDSRKFRGDRSLQRSGHEFKGFVEARQDADAGDFGRSTRPYGNTNYERKGQSGERSDLSGRDCYNCKQKGHVSRDCPDRRSGREQTSGGKFGFGSIAEGDSHKDFGRPNHRREMTENDGGRICYNCKQLGHISRDCPEKRSGGSYGFKSAVGSNVNSDGRKESDGFNFRKKDLADDKKGINISFDRDDAKGRSKGRLGQKDLIEKGDIRFRFGGFKSFPGCGSQQNSQGAESRFGLSPSDQKPPGFTSTYSKPQEFPSKFSRSQEPTSTFLRPQEFINSCSKSQGFASTFSKPKMPEVTATSEDNDDWDDNLVTSNETEEEDKPDYDLNIGFGHTASKQLASVSSSQVLTRFEKADLENGINFGDEVEVFRSDKLDSADPHSFYVHLCRNHDTVENLFLNELPAGVVNLKFFKNEMACVALCSGKYCRGEVAVSRGENERHMVRFVDFGNVELVDDAAIYELDEKFPRSFLSPTRYSYHCKLSDIAPANDDIVFNTNAKRKFSSLISDGPLRLRFLNKLPEFVFEVSVSLKNGESLSEAMCKSGHAVPVFQDDDFEDAESFTARTSEPLFRIGSAQLGDVSFGVPVDGFRSDYLEESDPASFHIQLCRDESIVDELGIANLPEEPFVLTSREEYRACVAFYSEASGYYRGELIKEQSSSGYAIRFVDFGNVVELGDSEIYQIDDQFPAVFSHPFRFAFHCKLANIAPSNNEDYFSHEAKVAFSTLTTGTMKICFLQQPVEDIFEIDLLLENGQSVSQLLCENGYAVPITNCKAVSDASKIKTFKVISEGCGGTSSVREKVVGKHVDSALLVDNRFGRAKLKYGACQSSTGKWGYSDNYAERSLPFVGREFRNTGGSELLANKTFESVRYEEGYGQSRDELSQNQERDLHDVLEYLVTQLQVEKFCDENNSKFSPHSDIQVIDTSEKVVAEKEISEEVNMMVQKVCEDSTRRQKM